MKIKGLCTFLNIIHDSFSTFTLGPVKSVLFALKVISIHFKINKKKNLLSNKSALSADSFIRL